MNVDRLTHMADILDKVSSESRPFNTATWFNPYGEALDCNISAGAVGWGCRDEHFQSEGLGVYHCEDGCRVPSYNDKDSWQAVYEFFDLNIDDAGYLFGDYYNDPHVVTAAEVAAKIRNFVKKTVMNRERLKNLAGIMERVAAESLPFDMRSWFADDGPNVCGTAACVGGWACRDASFQEQGLGTNILEISPWTGKKIVAEQPLYDGRVGFEALVEFFGIDWYAGQHIFAPCGSNDPSDAVRRIRDVLDGSWKSPRAASSN